MTITWTELLLQALLQMIYAAVMAGVKHLVRSGGHGWVRTNDPPLVRRVLFH